jgi:hypothetical protein
MQEGEPVHFLYLGDFRSFAFPFLFLQTILSFSTLAISPDMGFLSLSATSFTQNGMFLEAFHPLLFFK